MKIIITHIEASHYYRTMKLLSEETKRNHRGSYTIATFENPFNGLIVKITIQ